MITKLSQLHLALDKQAGIGSALLRGSGTGAVLGGGVGATVGAFKDKEDDRSRLGQILRSALTGAAAGAGTGAGLTGGAYAGGHFGGKLGLESMLAGIFSGGVVGATAGGKGSYELSKSRPNPPSKFQKIKAVLSEKNAHFEKNASRLKLFQKLLGEGANTAKSISSAGGRIAAPLRREMNAASGNRKTTPAMLPSRQAADLAARSTPINLASKNQELINNVKSIGAGNSKSDEVMRYLPRYRKYLSLLMQI